MLSADAFCWYEPSQVSYSVENGKWLRDSVQHHDAPVPAVKGRFSFSRSMKIPKTS